MGPLEGLNTVNWEIFVTISLLKVNGSIRGAEYCELGNICDNFFLEVLRKTNYYCKILTNHYDSHKSLNSGLL